MCGHYTLEEVVEKYCLRQFNDKRKNFSQYLAIAQDIWEKVFLRTLWAYQAQWFDLCTSTNDPYPYLKLPKNIATILGIYFEDDCKKIVPLYTNNNYSVVKKPAVKKCKCNTDCGCGDGCEAVNNFTLITKEIKFDIEILNESGNGIISANTVFYERIWMEKCQDGDIIEWREVPTIVKLDNPIIINGKPYYYQLKIVKLRNLVCKLELLPCGCVKETDENKKAINDLCLCFNIEKLCETRLKSDVSPNVSETKINVCGDKAYIINPEHTQYLILYQVRRASETVLVPFEAIDSIMTGIDWEIKRFNPMISSTERKIAKYEYNDALTELVKYYNPIDFENLTRIHEKPMRI